VFPEIQHMRLSIVLSAALLAGCAAAPALPPAAAPDYDVLVRGGTFHDGSGGAPRQADIGIRGDRVAAVGDLGGATAATVVDAAGFAVAPGFINMLSWSTESLMADPRALSDLKQGVTLEVFGEGSSMGPLNDSMRAIALARQSDIRYEIDWSTLAGWLEGLERPPTVEELARMQELVREAMREGALGVGASLIYAPAFYAQTPELVALAAAAGEFGGGYIAHLRSEADRFVEALDELIGIARDAGVRAEVYHLKAAGRHNWPKMAQAIARIEAARAEGLPVSANMYTYVAGATGLDAAMPPWVQEGGLEAWIARLRDPAQRARTLEAMRTPSPLWENLYRMAGSPGNVKFIGFRNPALKPLTGKTLAQVMAERGTDAENTMIDLVIEDGSRVDTAYFLMSEDNVELGIRQPWVSFGSDAEASAPEGVFLLASTHPRAYGNFARLLGHYVRERGVIPLPEAIRRLTRLPAQNWRLAGRGCLDPGCFADLVVFDPATIRDHATFDQPQRFATGVRDVLVNGVPVLRDGAHTGALPGRVVRGPGWRQP
jgi:N-acyl-D-amino-acid deacylase